MKLSSNTKTGLGCLSIIIAIILFIGTINLVSSWLDDYRHKSKEVSVSEKSYDGDWPLTVSEGKIYARTLKPQFGERIAVIFIAPNGREYGLNGTAQSEGYADIHNITRVDTNTISESYMEVSGLISIGLSVAK